MQGAPPCQTQPKDFGITEMYRISRHLYDPYLTAYWYGNYWPEKIRHYCNGKSKWIYLHKDHPSVRSFLGKNQTDSRYTYDQIIKRLSIRFAVEYLFFNNNCILNGTLSL